MHFPKYLLLVAVSFALLTAGCGGGDQPTPQADDTSQDTPTVSAEPVGTASITGTIHFSGTPPERATITQDQECEELHDTAVLAENVVVNDNSTVKYVFVYVKEGLGDYTFPTPTEPVVLDQEGCMYQPHVFGVHTGQTILIRNSDPLQHNIHALPDVNRGFNLSTPNEGDEREREFRQPEIMVRIKCDVHGWMSAYAGVLDHPYFSVTGDDGTFSIEGLPAGEYVIEAWHETYGTQTQTVTVGDGEAASADFSLGEGA
ncbi:MAG: carboxypeptidase regulatory-like domain-containing protein [Rhodothermales bacterium]